MLPFEFELDIGALLFASDYVTNLYCEIILSKFFLYMFKSMSRSGINLFEIAFKTNFIFNYVLLFL
jgi:hypothetical protein